MYSSIENSSCFSWRKKSAQENARLVAKNYEIVKLRQIIEEDVRVEELEHKNTELEARLAILEQSSLVVGEQPQNDKETIVEVLPEVTVSNIDLSNTVIDQRNNVDTKTSGEMEMDAFLVEVNKKSICDKFRERKREKKVQHNTIAKDSS
ncbi:hypothetical protein GLOIN_2v1738467 [Rhizophagus irregularis DAOM 181602=DAOM 197198]|uniref:Uncharacterized protein n=1 Tax=Rhizophagus irregularis (strain DAOM 181602 / DAOM 197198 / MUCL 43194) TaxID=747089 RepID=A0A2P4NWU8_RHIID|nr:hypothetical protein GLOIN_2v1738467 [Rhizophagus irregularis DAOM 181602=DAOM 197198]POG57612.1 hypothetical protein GLOIN_2v1738467 [Rhizophagus irregularis DAOM 181602=DAOM 197198]|eukprot:XP_025164478.1 hypothetical protein GLOIN_2v1738467 [Rhizophagus irregularis DAOM 181602=DAOM 197198]